MQKTIVLLHRHPQDRIKETNAAFPYLQKKGIEVLTFNKFNRTGGFIKFWKSLAWIIYAPFLIHKRYDVIYCDDSYPFYPALVKLFNPKSQVVIRLGDLHLMYYYSGIVYKILHYFEKLTWKLSDKIIVISEAMADYVEEEIGVRPYVVLDPVDSKDFELKSDIDRRSVMFHGVLTKNKNVNILLKAARLMPGVQFDIVGLGPDIKRLKQLATSNVFFWGWVPFKDISKMISQCAIGVALRSNNQGNEYVVTSPFLQYGIMGKPCLVTKRKVYGDYEWQFTNVYELREMIKYLLIVPNDEGFKLREYILANHDAKKIADQIYSLLN